MEPSLQAMEPSILEVMTNIQNLYNNPDTTAKDKASKWLAEFQKSVSRIFSFGFSVILN